VTQSWVQAQGDGARETIFITIQKDCFEVGRIVSIISSFSKYVLQKLEIMEVNMTPSKPIFMRVIFISIISSF
jgi:hypothetical protein